MSVVLLGRAQDTADASDKGEDAQDAVYFSLAKPSRCLGSRSEGADEQQRRSDEESLVVTGGDVGDFLLDSADCVVLVLECSGEVRLSLRRVQACEVEGRDGEDLVREERVRNCFPWYLALPGVMISPWEGGGSESRVVVHQA